MRNKIVAMIFITAILISSPGQLLAFGLGEIQINSSLNQPMDAEIELVGFKANQIDEVFVELANQEMFERVGVPRPYILTRLKFTPMIAGGKPIIKVTSKDAIREPFLTFLIDVRWAKGKVLREFTVLLDPPVFGDQAKATIQAPKVTSSAPAQKKSAPKSSNIASTPAPRTPAPTVQPKQATVPSTVSKPVPLKKTKPQQPPGSRSVVRGDTLWSIAEPYAREKGVSVNQMMLAIQSANPESFAGNNINNLKSGVILRIPSDNLANYTAKEALAEVQRQWQVWKQGATPVPTSSVNVDASDVEASDAAPVSDAEQPEADASASSKLSILGEGDALEGKSGDDAQAALNELRQQVNLLKENSESKGQENAELKDRIESLESMIKKQEDIISLQNEQLAQLQNSLSTSGSDEAQAVIDQQAEALKEVAEEASEMLAQAQESAALVVDENSQQANQIIKPASVEPLPDFSGPIPDEFLAADQGSETEAAESLGEQAELIEQASTVEPAEVQAPVNETPQVSLLDKVMAVVQEQGQNLIYAGGGILALLLAWLGIKRRKANREATDVAASGLPAFVEEPSVDDNLDDTVVATPDSVDEVLDELEVVGEVANDGEQDEQLVTEQAESDDILAEADVYISYGLFQQAEELLKEGLLKDPNNTKYQFKLAEIYHGDKKSDEFVSHVESIADKFDKQSPDWSKIITMGAAIAPTHALFNGSDTAEVSLDAGSVADSSSDNIDDDVTDLESGDLEEFDAELSDDNSLDFAFDDDNALSELDKNALDDAEIDQVDSASTESLSVDSVEDASDDFLSDDEIIENDELEDSSTAMLEANIDLEEPQNDTQSFDLDSDESESVQANATEADATEVFLDFDQDELENELNAEVSHDSKTEMLDDSIASGIDLDDAINLDEEVAATDSPKEATISADLDEMLSDDNSETAMFDSSLFDVDSPEAKAFASDNDSPPEDTVSLEQVQENLTAELETLSFDSEDIDPENIEEDSLPTLETSEIGRKDMQLDGIDSLDENLAASETGTFERDMLSNDVTEQFDVGDVGDIDSTMTDLGEFGDDYDLETPSVIEEVGTKLDLAKAFVDMGDEDAAKETLTEVMEQGDQTQIQEAKDLLDKLS